jgi:hypothetical protein
VWTSSPNNNRLAIPAQGIADIRNSLSEILDEFGVDEGEIAGYIFIFPSILGSKNLGRFIKISLIF